MHELEETAKALGPPFSTAAATLSPRFAATYGRLQQGDAVADDLYSCLEQLLKLFTGLSAGLVSFLDPSRPEISALAAGLEQPLQYERLLRFSINLLQQQEENPARSALLQIFFPARRLEELSVPLHTIWLQLGSEASPLPPLSRWQEHMPDREDLTVRYSEILQSWVESALTTLQTSRWQFGIDPKSGKPQIQSWIFQGQVIPLLPSCPWDGGEDTLSSSSESEWSPQWSVAQRERIHEQLKNRFPNLSQARAPEFLLAPTRQELARHASAYLLIEAPDGCGKSLALSCLQHDLSQELPFLHFPVRACFRGDFQTFIEEIDEGIQLRLDSQHTTMVPLGPLVIQELNRRYSALSPSEKLQAYLSQLVLRNGQRFILALDGLDEAFEGADSDISLADYLPDSLPDGVFLLLSYRLEGCSPRLGRRLTQLMERGAVALHFPVRSPAYRDWYLRILRASFISEPLALELVSSGYSLMHGRLLGQGLESGILPVSQRPTEGEVVTQLLEELEQVWGEPLLRLLMVLATSYAPVPLDEISDLGFDPSMLQGLLPKLPALFLVIHPSSSSGWQLQLAHQYLRLHLQEHYSHRYSQTCQRLAARAAHQLMDRPMWSNAENETLEAGSHRLDCLYRWLLDSQNMELTESVVTSQPLRQFRNRVCGFLEQRGRFHHKLAILQGLKSCLEVVLQFHDSTELRDELAWAYNSRGLTYLHLGQFGQGLQELEFAEQQFRVLVDHRNNVHYRSGLASALNRRSEALRALGQVGEAWECAHQSVEHHRQSLVEGGPQQPRLGLARSLVQRARCAADHSLWPRALTDLQEALTLLEHSTRQAQARSNPAEVATHFDEWIRALIVRAEAYRVVGENDNCLLDLDQALLLTQHLEEVQAVDWTNTKAPEVQVLQARAYEALQGKEEAQEAYDEAIQGYSQQVRQGRLDLRLPLAEAYNARADLNRRCGRIEQAVEDFTRSLAFQAQLIECEEQSNLRPFRAQAYHGRGDCLAALLRRREALQDYDKSIEDYLFGLNSGKLQQGDLRKLATVYFDSGQLHQDLGEPSQAADRATSAIRLLEERLSGTAEEAVAQAHLLQAEALFQLGDIHTGLESASKAIQALSLRVRGGSCNLERQLAQAHRLRAGLSHRLGDLNQALKDYGLSFHLYGGEGLEPDRLQQAGVLRRRASLQVELKEYEAALEDLSAAFDLLSDNRQEAEEEKLQLRRLRAHIYGLQERPTQAISELLQALEEQRQSSRGPANKIELLLELLGWQSRLSLWQEFSILYSEFLVARQAVPELDVTAPLEGLFREIEAQGPDTSQEKSHHEAEARTDVLVALARLHGQLKPDGSPGLQARALHQRGNQRLRTHRITEALEDLSEAIALLRAYPESLDAPLLIDLYSQRAEGFAKVGLESRALRDLEEASEMLADPERDMHWLARLTTQKAALLRKQGLYPQVVSEINQVLSFANQCDAFSSNGEKGRMTPEVLSWLYLARGLAHDQMKHQKQAVSDFREAAQLLSQLQESQLEVLHERLRCRLRLLALEDPSHGNFLLFCAEDSLTCLSRLRLASIELASAWLVPWVHHVLGLSGVKLPDRFLGDMVEEVSHYQPGPLNTQQCESLSQLLGQLASRSESPALSERLLGIALNLGLLGSRANVPKTLLDGLSLLYKLYQSHPEQVPALQLEPTLRALQEIAETNPPSGELGVHWNNVVRAWLLLPDHQLVACDAERHKFQALRLW